MLTRDFTFNALNQNSAQTPVRILKPCLAFGRRRNPGDTLKVTRQEAEFLQLNKFAVVVR